MCVVLMSTCVHIHKYSLILRGFNTFKQCLILFVICVKSFQSTKQLHEISNGRKQKTQIKMHDLEYFKRPRIFTNGVNSCNFTEIVFFCSLSDRILISKFRK